MAEAKEPSVVDGSIGQLLFAVIKHIGGWDPEQILVETLPADLFDRLALLAQRNVEESTNAQLALGEFFSTIIGEGNFGDASIVDVDLAAVDGSVPEQVFKTGVAMGVQPDGKLMLSAMMTGLTEAPIDGGKSFGNPEGGDQTGVPGSSPTRQSSGWRQETLSSYPGVDRRNVPESAKRYFSEGQDIIKKSGGNWSGSAGELSNAIQRSAYPYKADGVRSAALALLRKISDKVGTSGDTSSSDDSVSPEVPDSTNESDSSGKYYSPIKGLKMQTGSVPTMLAGLYGDNRGDHIHAGLDCAAALGTTLYAICDSVVTYAGAWGDEGGLIMLQSKNAIPGYTGKPIMGYGHASAYSVKKGDEVKGGQVIGKSGAGKNNEPHLHFFVTTDKSRQDGNVDPMALMTAAVNGEEPTGEVAPAENSSTGGSNEIGASVATSLATNLALPSVLTNQVGRYLGNERSLMNDVPLLPFVQQLSQASLRHFQSMPDGKFYAYYPDYFGEVKHHLPYWEIEDIEILEGKVRLTDDSLVTHSFVVGDTASDLSGGTADSIRMLQSAGIVTIFNAFTAADPSAKFSGNEVDPDDKRVEKKKADEEGTLDLGSRVGGLGVLMQNDEALAFLNRYGARPVMDDQPSIHAPQFELFLAYQQFMLGWSRQFLTPFRFTFMPELYPGGKVGFPSHGFQMYIESVTHTFDYEGGFTTEAQLSSPSAYGPKESMLPNDMIRAIVEPSSKTVVAMREAAEKEEKAKKTKAPTAAPRMVKAPAPETTILDVLSPQDLGDLDKAINP